MTDARADETVAAIAEYAADAVHAIEEVIEHCRQLRHRDHVSVSRTTHLLGVPHATAQRLLGGGTPTLDTLRTLRDR